MNRNPLLLFALGTALCTPGFANEDAAEQPPPTPVESPEALGMEPEPEEAAGTGGAAAVERQPASIQDLAGSNWKLVEGSDARDALDLTAAADGIRLEIREPGEAGVGIGGRSSVNGYFSSATSEEAGKVTVAPIGATRMAGPEPAMELERRYFAALSASTTLETQGDALIFSGEDISLRFLPDGGGE